MRLRDKVFLGAGCAAYAACVMFGSVSLYGYLHNSHTEIKTEPLLETASPQTPQAQPTAATYVADCVAETVQPEPPIETWKYPMPWDEYLYVRRVVMAESGNQPIAGQMAVAQCILNTAKAEGLSPYQVVTTPGQYANPYSKEVNQSVREACDRVFRDGETVVDAEIRWFYAPKYCYSSWHESKTYVTTIGWHKFFA